MTLTKADRCDACHTAEAMVKVSKPRANDAGEPEVVEFKFCGHHYECNSAALELSGFEIVIDQRALLTQKQGENE